MGLHVPTDHGSQFAMHGTTWVVFVSMAVAVPVPVSMAVSVTAVPKPIAVV